MRKRDLASANWSILLNRYEYREFCENNRIKTPVSVQPKLLLKQMCTGSFVKIIASKLLYLFSQRCY
jgi:hypothetical protein